MPWGSSRTRTTADCGPDNAWRIRAECLANSTWAAICSPTWSANPVESVIQTEAAASSSLAWEVGSAATYTGSALLSRLAATADAPHAPSARPAPVRPRPPATAPHPEGEHAPRLGPPDGVHLVDAQECAGGQDHRVRPTVVVPLRPTGQRQRADPCLLGGDDVHDDRRGIDRQPPGHIQTHTLHRDPALVHLCALAELGGRWLGQLRPVTPAGTFDRFGQRRAQIRCEVLQRLAEYLLGHA